MIILTEPSVDYQKLSIGTKRLLSLSGPHWRMAIDDMRHGGIQPEFPQYHIASFFLMVKLVIGVGFFFPSALILQERAFKRLDIPARQRRLAAAPEVPHKVKGIVITFSIVCPSCRLICIIQIRFALVCLTFKGNALKIPRIVHGNAAMVQQIIIENPVHASFLIQKFNMALQADAVQKSSFQLF